jgi:hypothetical protein
MGLGYYHGQKFVHMDYRQGYPKTAWTSKHEGAPYHYHPKWARR